MLTQDDGLRTMLDVVQKHVECTPDHRLFTWVDKKCCETKTLTYREVWHGAGAGGSLLHAGGYCEGTVHALVTKASGLLGPQQ